MTVTVLIDPIVTTTKNGTTARLTGIDMTSGDPFSGEIEFEPGKFQSARWRSNGNIRDAHPYWNLDLNDFEVKQLYEVAKNFGARLS